MMETFKIKNTERWSALFFSNTRFDAKDKSSMRIKKILEDVVDSPASNSTSVLHNLFLNSWAGHSYFNLFRYLILNNDGADSIQCNNAC